VSSPWNFVTKVALEKLKWWKVFDDMCIHLDTVPQCNRQTDGQTVGFAKTISRSACSKLTPHKNNTNTFNCSPLAVGPLERKPTLFRLGFSLSCFRMMSLPGKFPSFLLLFPKITHSGNYTKSLLTPKRINKKSQHQLLQDLMNTNN